MSGTKLGVGEQDTIKQRHQGAGETVMCICTEYIEKLSVLPGGGTQERIS